MYMNKFFEQQKINNQIDKIVITVVAIQLIDNAIDILIDDLIYDGKLSSTKDSCHVYRAIYDEVTDSIQKGYTKDYNDRMSFIKCLLDENCSFSEEKQILDSLLKDNNKTFEKLVGYLIDNKLAIPSLEEHITIEDWKRALNITLK